MVLPHQFRFNQEGDAGIEQERHRMKYQDAKMDASKPILIVGAGISGLAMAQALRQAGLPFKVFESDSSTSFRTQGYRIRLQSDSLQACLPSVLWTKFKDSSGKPPQGIGRMNAITTQSLPFDFGPSRDNEDVPMGPPPILDTFTADRAVLRALLLEGLEDTVAFNHKLRRFDIASGGVVAHFENGKSYEGVLLIAADGSGSVIRRQHLPGHDLLDTGLRCIYGKTILTKELLQAFPAIATQQAFLAVDIRNSSDNQEIALFVETMRFQDNDIQASLPDDYVYWVLLGNEWAFTEPEQMLFRLTGEEAAQLSKQITKQWHKSLRTLLELQDSSRTAALHVSTTSPEIPPWEACSRITFIGDAIHLMPPTAGIGANTALEDVVTLARILVGEGITEASIKRYEDDMRKRAMDAIGKSLVGAQHMVGLGHWSTFKKLN